ncbi:MULTISPECIES: response regulator [Priestia]|uniref:response regulator n=1 Tax=Priestia TaxID=2800373 RepID=UPI001C8EF49B|nr:MULTISPECIES: response regulator [Priestia]MBX9987851.1 response regulator [Priestia aryabhattai]MBX9998527.1 response regulator [Priestia aryabhattai]UYV54034.1 response regulator [Priestia megaterium]
MRFYIIDDDEVFRSMLAEIIEDNDLGEVIGEGEDGIVLNDQVSLLQQIDILFIDLLMPIQDGIETVRKIKDSFKGKIIMMSQVETKDLIGKAYSLGIEYYITKPLNRMEVLMVIQKVIERIHVQQSMEKIQESLNTVLNVGNQHKTPSFGKKESDPAEACRFLLRELGILGESGSKDLIEIINYLHQTEKSTMYEQHFPSLKEIFEKITVRKLGSSFSEDVLQKEMKAAEQRVRRAIYQSLNHLTSLGMVDFFNPKFENYASKFFDFSMVHQRMRDIEKGTGKSSPPSRINVKKFIQMLYYEVKQTL